MSNRHGRMANCLGNRVASSEASMPMRRRHSAKRSMDKPYCMYEFKMELKRGFGQKLRVMTTFFLKTMDIVAVVIIVVIIVMVVMVQPLKGHAILHHFHCHHLLNQNMKMKREIINLIRKVCNIFRFGESEDIWID